MNAEPQPETAGETEESFGQALFRELRKWPTFDKPTRPTDRPLMCESRGQTKGKVD